MKTYRDGQSAPYGLFVSLRPLDTRFVGAADEELEGIPGAVYKRLPNVVAVAMVPVLGGIFVLLFPLLVLLVSSAGIFRAASGKLRPAEAAPPLVSGVALPQESGQGAGADPEEATPGSSGDSTLQESTEEPRASAGEN